MTSAAAAPASSGRLAIWCGWVLVAIMGAVPAFAWLAPKGFAALVALGGLLTLPALRLADEDRPALIVLFGALIWAAASTTWSPYHPTSPANNSVLKLALELPIFFSFICAARRADERWKRRARAVAVWGFTVFGAILILETLTRGALYQHLRDVAYQPLRQDIAEAKLGHATFVMTVLLPLVGLGASPRLRPWLILVMAVGAAGAALAFQSDAPVIALVLAPAVGLAAWRHPRATPAVMAALAAAYFLAMPLVVWLVRRFTDYGALQQAIPLSYAERLGYWSHAVDWIAQKPLRGWGLEASRMFVSGIRLHPHNGALQVWLELGVVGAVGAAAFWSLTLLRLSRPRFDLVTAATAACSAVYLLFGAINFGVWQEWWLAMGVLIAALAALNQPSTEAPI